MEAGMGVPRESVHLAGDPDTPRMLGDQSGTDWTGQMNRYSSKRSRELAGLGLSGFIFKSRSPSCGLYRVKLNTAEGHASNRKTTGLFARRIVERYPLLPVEEEGRLNDIKLRENFIIRVFAFYRLRELFGDGFKRADAIRFHTVYKFLMLAHSPKHYRQLVSLVAGIKKMKPSNIRDQYSAIFMEGLKLKATPAKNTNVLLRMAGYLKKQLDPDEKKYVHQVIYEYHRHLAPLVVPVTLMKHFVEKYNVEYLADQVYLSPHPKELMLRNHV